MWHLIYTSYTLHTYLMYICVHIIRTSCRFVHTGETWRWERRLLRCEERGWQRRTETQRPHTGVPRFPSDCVMRCLVHKQDPHSVKGRLFLLLWDQFNSIQFVWSWKLEIQGHLTHLGTMMTFVLCVVGRRSSFLICLLLISYLNFFWKFSLMW